MDHRRPRLASALLILGVTLVVVAGLSFLLWVAARVVLQGGGGRGRALPERSQDDRRKHETIDPALIGYEQTGAIPVGMRQARALAIGPERRIYVAGDKSVRIFQPDGTQHAEIALEEEPRCLAVAAAGLPSPGLIYVGFTRQADGAPREKGAAGRRGHVEVYGPDGSRQAVWEPIDGAVLTSIAVAEQGVFVADAGNRVVHRFDAAGKRIGRIDGRNQDPGSPGFVIPSPFFDVAVGPDGLLWVVNPGLLKLQAYTADGKLQLFWGGPSSSIEGFFGCCNPAHFTFLPDGRFVTAEKGLLRVKVYSPHGELLSVVAGPEQLDSHLGAEGNGRFEHEYKAVDVAADSRGRVLVLDPGRGRLRIFEPKQGKPSESKHESL